MLKRHYLLILSCLWLFTCKQPVKTSSLDTPFSITKSTEADFNAAKPGDGLTHDTLLYKKKKGIIKLPINDKWQRYIIFSDTLVNSEDRGKEYNYLGQFKNIGYYLVSGVFYEHSEEYLINKLTGDKLTIWSDPKISPNNKFIADIQPYGLEGEPNGIQIWRVEKNNGSEEPIAISSFVELNEQIWVPEDFAWANDNSLIIKAISMDKYLAATGDIKPNPRDFYYLKIKVD